MLEHVLNLGNQLKTDLEISEGFTSIDYDRMLIVGMGGSGVGCWDYILTVVGVTGGSP